MEHQIKIAVSCLEYPGVDLNDIFAKIKDWGVEYVEIGYAENLLPLNYGVSDLSQMISRRQLRIAALNVAALKYLKDTLDIAGELGVKMVILRDGGDIETQTAKNVALHNYKNQLAAYWPQVAKHGIKIALENTTIGITRHPDDLRKLIDHIGSDYFGVNYDPSNFYNAGAEGYPYGYEVLKDKIAYVHAKDSTRYKENLYGQEIRVLHRAGGNVICVPLGKGALNWEGIMTRLLNDGYQGFIGIEPHTQAEAMDDMFIQNIQYLRKLLLKD